MVTLDAIRTDSQAETSDRLSLDTDAIFCSQREMVRTNQSVLRQARLSLNNCFRMHTFGQSAGVWPIVNLEELIRLSGSLQPPSRFRRVIETNTAEDLADMVISDVRIEAQRAIQNHVHEPREPAVEHRYDPSETKDIRKSPCEPQRSSNELHAAVELPCETKYSRSWLSCQSSENQLSELREQEIALLSETSSTTSIDFRPDAPDRYDEPISVDCHNARTWQFHFAAPFVDEEDEFFQSLEDSYHSNSPTEKNLPVAPLETGETCENPLSLPLPTTLVTTQPVGTSGKVDSPYESCILNETLHEDLMTIVAEMLAKREELLTLSVRRVAEETAVAEEQEFVPDFPIQTLSGRLSDARRKARLQQLRSRQDDVARIDGAFQSFTACLIMAAVLPILVFALATIAVDLIR